MGKYLKAILIMVVLLTSCQSKPPAEQTLETLIAQINEKIEQSRFDEAKIILRQVKDDNLYMSFYSEIIHKQADINNAASLFAEIESLNFPNNPLVKSTLHFQLESAISMKYNYDDLMSVDQIKAFKILALCTYAFIEDFQFTQANVEPFLSMLVFMMKNLPVYSTLAVTNDLTMPTEKAQLIMRDAFGFPNFDEFVYKGDKVDVSFIGMGGPGDMIIESAIVGPIWTTFEMALETYEMDGSAGKVFRFKLLTRYNPTSIFGFTIESLIKS